MVIVAGTMKVEPGKRDAFLKARETSIEATRKEPGCLEYGFAADAYEPDTIRIFERWETKADLGTHLQVLASAKPDPDAPQIKVLGAEVTQYEISASGPIGS